MTDLASYIYTTYSTILSLSKEELLQVGYNTNDANPIPSFDQELLISLCSEAQAIFSDEDIVLELDGDVIVVGDIHGSLHDLLRILNYIDTNQYKILFLGDYVDRGNFSLECISLLFSLKILFPNNYFLLRGNHEFDSVCTQYGFKKEILPLYIPEGNSLPKFKKSSSYKTDPDLAETDLNASIPKDDSFELYIPNHTTLRNYQYNESLYNAFIKAFSYLPISAIINKTTICIHGGISPHLSKVDNIRNSIKRPIDNFDDNELLCDLLWSDPSKHASDISQLFDENPRGRGKLFSGIAVSDFLKNNFLRRLIRGHECVNSGTEIKFNEKCITVFSASSYNKVMGNKSGILKVLKNDDKIEPVSFMPIEHLIRSNANFFKVQPFFEKDNPQRMSKPFFTMATVRPLGKAHSDQLFVNTNDGELRELNMSLGSLTAADGGFPSRAMKNANGCPIVQLNRKTKLHPKNVRGVNGSFAFNTGIRQKRKSSVSCLGHLQKGLKIPAQRTGFQSDEQAEIKVEKMGLVESDNDAVVSAPLPPKVLPKLVSKSEA